MELGIHVILSLAAVDAINPCALAVLTLILIAILVRYPKNRNAALRVGFAFTAAVFVMYFFYGLIIIQLFQSFTVVVGGIKLYLYTGLGILAVILGLLNIKDFFRYGGGGFVMEVPRKWRPSMKKLISGVTSAPGAIIIGMFVSVFLLPCTIGPYIIAGGLLSTIELIATIPWLLLYNLVFILPMLGITVAVWAGFTTVHKTSGWREKNLQRLHLVAGLIMLGLGLALVFGLV